MQKILFLSPHTDDVELGCGGTLARLVSEGKECHVVAFSHAGNINLIGEYYASMQTFGIQGIFSIENDPIRNFPEHRQEMLDTMIYYGKRFQPDTVFCPSSYDTHQDHEVIRQEAFRAFKQCTILGYEMPWNNKEFRTDLFISLDAAHMDTKLKAVECYKSQQHRPYCNPELIRGFAACRGAMAGVPFAECFEVIRMVL